MSLAKKINLRPDEEIVHVTKVFWFTYFWLYLFGFIFLGTASFFMFWLFSKGTWGYVLYGLVILIGLYIIFRTWYFKNKNISVITSQRVVDISCNGWFDEYISVVHFNNISDIYVRKQGVWSSIFNYGSVVVETIDDQSSLKLTNISSPQNILDILIENKNLFVDSKTFRDQHSVYKAFVNIIPDLDEAQLCEIHDLVDEQLKLID
ncbi:MAG: PH domain-containing protein [Candidatus Magasanikbacteria bacterium]|jgi:hypothetical protein